MNSIRFDASTHLDVSSLDVDIYYEIDGVTDPATGEVRDDTSWTAVVTEAGRVIRTDAGYGDGFTDVLLEGNPLPIDDQLRAYTIDVVARNDASEASVSQHINVQAAPFSGVEGRIDFFVPAHTLTGGEGSDLLIGSFTDDTLLGRGGDDVLLGGNGSGTLDGGSGNDILRGSGHLYGGMGDDSLTGIGLLDGGAGDDQLLGAGTLLGGEGDDTLIARYGAATMEGGAGSDYLSGYGTSSIVSYAHSPAAVGVDLAGHMASGGDAQGDRIYNIGNVIGSEFDDRLSGDAAANHLFGGAGADMLRGGDGNDTIAGDAGADTMFGGAGADTLSYVGSSAGVTVDIATGTAAGGDAAGDRSAEFENLRGSSFGDTLTGDGGANALSGDAGDDVLDGGGGNDLIEGGAGADRLIGGGGINTLAYKGDVAGVSIDLVARTASGGDATGDSFIGFANVIGGAGGDRLIGDSHANSLVGNAGDDTILAGAGDDYVDGGTGSNVLSGGSGIDRLSYSSSLGGVRVDLGFHTSSYGDAISQFENLVGSRYDDFLSGDSGNNEIDGLGGDDRLEGRKGDDVLTGGDGRDTFTFRTGDGHDRIADFATADRELIRLVLGTTYDSYREVMAAAHASGGDTVFDFGGGDTLTLSGVTPAQLSAGNFLYT
jgi:Ca2+-binding RTX toxin-like protein